MKEKAVADGEKLNAGMAAISRNYSTHGYIDFAIRQKQNFDDDAHIVSYDFNIAEGPQYHMGKITFAGVSDATAKKLASQWQLKPGDIYDGTYFVTFFKKTALPKLASGKPGVQFTPSLKRDQQTDTVDVTITFQ